MFLNHVLVTFRLDSYVLSNDLPYSIDGLLMEALMAVKMIKNHETFSKAVKEYRTMMY